MARLLDDLLDVSRISRGTIELDRQVVDLAEFIGRAVDAARPLIDERRHRLSLDLPADRLSVEVDPTRIEQVVINLLNNAAKYTEPGGDIRISVEKSGGEIVLCVCDTGVGIESDHLGSIFDLFVQANPRIGRAQGGVGIGLTLVRKLVELHGGSVQAFSEGSGRGSEFVVRLPAHDGIPPAAFSPNRDRAAATPLPRRRVLLADDNKDAVDTLAMLLTLLGQDVRKAYSGEEALVIAAEHRPEIVLLDLGMPDLDGFEVARKLREQPALNGARLVAITGWGQQEDRRRTRDAGFDEHLIKPVDAATLRRVLAS
jgi:CheY-like chemotaxis protein/two-component sensor histidine kinase